MDSLTIKTNSNGHKRVVIILDNATPDQIAWLQAVIGKNGKVKNA